MREPRYVLDTHACVFALCARGKLGAKARTALRQVEQGRGTAWLPAAVVAEVLMLRELGRTRLGLPELRAVIESAPGFRFLPLDLDQLDEFAALGSLRDPFDRLVVSAARSVRARLITRDEELSASGLVDTVWG